MEDFNFNRLLARVYSWWPEAIEPSAYVNDGAIDIGEFDKIYDSEIAPLAEASGSRLLIQLDWILYGAVVGAVKIVRVVRIKEVRVDYVRNRFHELIATVGMRQLRGEQDPDGSFDMAELAKYVSRNKLAIFKDEVSPLAVTDNLQP